MGKPIGYVRCVFTIFALAMAGPLFAQEIYPSKPVTIVVGFAPGGTADLLARSMAQSLSEDLKQSFVVVNRPGANGNLGTVFVSKSPADGYTLLMAPFGLTVNEYLYKNVGYSLKSFEAVALVAKVPNVIIANKSLGVSSVKDLVAFSKANPTAITYSSPGVGSSLHLAGELFRFETGAEMLHVPFNGGGPALMAVRAGEVKIGFESLSTAAPLIKTGDLKALAVTTERRSPAFPDIPTVGEAGFPKYEISGYFGLVAPAGTPVETIDKLNRATNVALEKSRVKAQLLQLGAIVEPGRPLDFGGFLNGENVKWRKVIQAAGITAN